MNVKKYHSLKESGVEWIEKIPTHWELRRIGQLFKFRNEKVSDEEYMPLSVTKDGVVPQLENVAKTMHNENRKKVLKGDIVINSRSDRRGSSGLAMLDGSCSLINHVLEPRVELEGKYIHYLFKSVPFCDEYYRWGTGIVDDLWSTQKDRMSQIQIPFPPINEQKSIARFLDHKINSMVKLKKMLEEKINKLKEYRSSLITQAVTKGLDPNVPMKDSGIEWLGEVPGHWIISKPKFYCLVNPESLSENTDADYSFEYVDISSVQRGKGIVSKVKMIFKDAPSRARRIVRKGDIIISSVRTYLKAVASIEEDFTTPIIVSTGFVVLRPNSEMLDSNFASYMLEADYFVEQVASHSYGVSYPAISAEELVNQKIILPPVEEQKRIVTYLNEKLSKVEKLIDLLTTQIQKLDTYRSSLITAAVTGQIDVSDWKEAEEELETIL